MKRIFMVLILAGAVSALPNPATGKCIQDGGTWTIRETPAGQEGICTFPSFSCDEWDYYNGLCHAPSHPPVGCHSHPTHYNITYSHADLDYNRTRTDIRNWLTTWTT